MNRYRITDPSVGYGIGYNNDEGYKKVFIIHWKNTEYIWEFGKGDSYDWDGYEKL